MAYRRSFRRSYGKRMRRMRGVRRPVRSGRRGGPLKEAFDIATIAQSAWQGVKYLKGLVNSEAHLLDTVGYIDPTSSTSSTANCVHLNGIAQGDNIMDRTGNSCLLKRLDIKGYVQMNSASSANDQGVRLAVVMDTQQVSDDTTITWQDVFEAVQPLTSFLQDSQLGRFTVLYDKVFHLSDLAGSFRKEFSVSVPLGVHVRFNGTAGTDIQKNGIWLMSVSDEAATSYPRVVYNARLRFHDN